jgi:hypothetical protein
MKNDSCFLIASIRFLSYDGMVEESPILRARVTLNIQCKVMMSREMPEMDRGLGVELDRYR